MIQSRVDVRAGFGDEISRKINARVKVDVAVASEHGAKVASDIASTRSRSGRMSRIDPVPVKGTPDGWTGGFKSSAFYSGMQSRGTLGARTRKVKAQTEARRSSASGAARYAKVSGRSGIKPLRHEERGLLAAKRMLVDRLNRITP